MIITYTLINMGSNTNTKQEKLKPKRMTQGRVQKQL